MKYKITIENSDTEVVVEVEKESDEHLLMMIAEVLDYLYVEARDSFLADLDDLLRNPNVPLQLPTRLPRTQLD